VALSSPLDIHGLREHLVSRGLTKQLLDLILDCSAVSGNKFMSSAFDWVGVASAGACALLPPVLLLHGDQDLTVPSTESLKMKFRLAQRRVPVTCNIYRGATHTSPLLETPFAGGTDIVLADVLKFMTGQDFECQFWPMLPFPKLVCSMARIASPF
jgi:hypothetical protein